MSETDLTATGCAHHPDRAAAWSCPKCDAGYCEECVRLYTAREVRFASCKTCGGACRPLDKRDIQRQRATDRAGAIEDAADRRRRLRRDALYPGVLLAMAVVLELGHLIAGHGSLTALAALPILLLATTAGLVAGYRLVCLFGESGFEPLGPTLLKLAAIALFAHAARSVVWAAFDPQLPRGGLTAVFKTIGLIPPLGITFVLVPVAVLFVTVRLLFHQELTEAVLTVVVLYLAQSLTLWLLLVAGAPGVL